MRTISHSHPIMRTISHSHLIMWNRNGINLILSVLLFGAQDVMTFTRE